MAGQALDCYGRFPQAQTLDYDESEIKDGMLQLACVRAVPFVTKCAALGDPRRMRDLRMSILRGELGSREIDMMRDTGCKGVVVRR
ncbi:hypothetical protein PoB_003783100 [Plakobranchus ocellatus]|uniref:DUS-like FMN-binding domain-containing protein n=1 Tax=Plakobranchus ocellatus TaxID=259542 RepID=A0AAV4AXS4_9GAST|nr:hypothetical protein PoB_003783100 [Plakobranchus ocellatus]